MDLCRWRIWRKWLLSCYWISERILMYSEHGKNTSQEKKDLGLPFKFV